MPALFYPVEARNDGHGPFQ